MAHEEPVTVSSGPQDRYSSTRNQASFNKEYQGRDRKKAGRLPEDAYILRQDPARHWAKSREARPACLADPVRPYQTTYGRWNSRWYPPWEWGSVAHLSRWE